MSHIDSVSPAGPITLAPGDTLDVDVLVSGVPGDDTGTMRFTASDGSTVTMAVTIDRAALEAILTGAPAANQVLGELVGLPGTLAVLEPIVGGYRFRYTAA